MKHLLALSVILLGFFPRLANAGEVDRLDLANKIVEKTSMSKMFVELAAASLENHIESYETPDVNDTAHVDHLKKIFEDEVSSGIEELTSMLAEIYASRFSEAELRQILSFFNSPGGAAWLDHRLAIQTEMEQIGLEWSELLSRRVLKKFERQYGEKFFKK